MKRTLARAGHLLAWLAAACALYLAVANTPQPAFAYHVRYGADEVWSDEPIPAAIAPVLDDANRRLRRSPLFDPAAGMRIFICNAPWRLWLYGQRFSTTMGGATSGVTRNILIHAADIPANALRMAPGRRLYDAGTRSLSYFIAHEGTHVIESRAFGRLAGLRYPRWLMEGYADYVAKGPDFQVAAQRGLYRAGALNHYPRDYQRFQLEVDHMLHARGRSIEQLFADSPSEQEVRALLDTTFSAPDPK